MTNKPKPGKRVRMTGKFLRSTGQYTGPEGLSRWVVQPCDCGLCKLGSHVKTDDDDRHIHVGNLEVCR